jgi:hypothetical protein
MTHDERIEAMARALFLEFDKFVDFERGEKK